MTLYGYRRENTGVSIYTRKLAESLGEEVVEPPRVLKPRALNQIILSGLKARSLDPDLIHFTNQDDLATLGFPDRKCVVTVHDIFRFTDPRMKLDLWRGRKYMENLEKADGIIAISEFTREQLVENGVEDEKIEVVYQGVDSEEFRPRGDVEHENYILHVGTEIERKNVQGLMRIISKMPDEYKLVRVGEQSRKAEKEMERLGLEKGEDVVYEKDVSFDRLRALYTNAEKLANPSLREGFGRTMLEAMLCGTPAIAYDRKPMNEVLPEKCLVKFEDEEEFADKLSQDFNFETREHAKQYSWDKTAEKTREVYSELEE